MSTLLDRPPVDTSYEDSFVIPADKAEREKIAVNHAAAALEQMQKTNKESRLSARVLAGAEKFESWLDVKAQNAAQTSRDKSAERNADSSKKNLSEKAINRRAWTRETFVKSGLHLGIGAVAAGLTIATGPGTMIVAGAFAARTGARFARGIHRANQNPENEDNDEKDLRLQKLTTDSDKLRHKFGVGAANLAQMPERVVTNAVLGRNNENITDKRRIAAHTLGAVAGSAAMFLGGRFLLRPVFIGAGHQVSKSANSAWDTLKVDTAEAQSTTSTIESATTLNDLGAMEGNSLGKLFGGEDSLDKTPPTETPAPKPADVGKDKNNNGIADNQEGEGKRKSYFYEKDKESPNAFGPEISTKDGPDTTFDHALERAEHDLALRASMLAEFDPKMDRADINNLINQMQDDPKLAHEKYVLLKDLSGKYDWNFETINGAYQTEYMQKGPDGKINVYADDYVNHGKESTGLVGVDKDGNKVQFRPECGFQPYAEKIEIPPVIDTPPAPETTPPGITQETTPPPTTQPPTTPPPTTPPPTTQPPTTPPPTTPPPTLTPKDPTKDINVNPDLPPQVGMGDDRVPAGPPTIPQTRPPVYEAPPAPTPVETPRPQAPPAPETAAPTPTAPGATTPNPF